MPIGDPNDFRTPTFMHVERFPGFSERGGVGSGFLPSFNPPAGASSLEFPNLNLPNIEGSSFNYSFPQMTINPPAIMTPPIEGGAAGGGGGPTQITVVDGNTPTVFTGIDTVVFDGAGLASVSNTGTGEVTVTIAGAGTGNTTLEYGQITAILGKANPNTAFWTYRVQLYSGGSPSGSPITAYNLFEYGNTAAVGYGMNVGLNGEAITGTSFSIAPVPVNTWVRVEDTNDPTGGASKYWFTAPNAITGVCP